MQISKNKTVAIIIALFLIASMAASMLLIPNTSAHTPPYEYKTYAKTVALPSPIGVGQSALIYAFLGNAPISGSAITNTFRFHNYTIEITDPDGKVQTYHWDTVQDTTGAQFFRFTPTIVGQYNITFTFGGQVLNSTYFDTTSSTAVGDVYLPSTATTTLTVQQDPIAEYPNSYPLPTEYWTRPIYGENTDWWTISSNWLGVGSAVLSSVSNGDITGIPNGSEIQRYPGDAVGPLTSHVMWTKPIQEGGVVGGNAYEIAGDTYFEGSAYQQRFINPIIVYGRLFYREPVSFLGPSSGDSLCVDLRSGQEIWRRNDLPTISFAYIPDVQNPNQHGVFPALLCTSNFGQCYDMYTGQNVFNVTGNPGGTLVMGPNGEYIKYNFFNNGTNSNPDWYLTEWNSTKMLRGTGYHPGESGNSPAFDVTTTTTTTNQSQTTYVNGVATTILTPVTTTTRVVDSRLGNRYDYLDDVTQNKSIPWRNNLPSSFSFSVVAAFYGDIMICRNGSYPTLNGQTQNISGVVSVVSTSWTYFAINLNASKGIIGSILWWSPAYSDTRDKTILFGGADPVARIFIETCKETQNFVGYSFANGQKLWETNEVNELQQQEITPLDYFGLPYFPYVATQLAYGNVYTIGYGGILFCYDLQTGLRLWSYGNGGTPGNNTDSGLQMPGPYPAILNAVGNGVIYTVSSQHTIITPIPKGNMARAINATTGEEIWTLNAYTGEFSQISYAMADGYATFSNGYDNQIYSVGKGPSAMTVSAPSLAAASNQPVIISGTVYDVSAGSKQNEQAARFANGLPCASDSIMTEWMGYVYQQKPLPTDFVGVSVDISVVDSNGNYRNIGTTTTDATGAYKLVWTPDISGNYDVFASFAGTSGYWPSSATTGFTVMETAPTATPAPTLAPSVSDMYFIPVSAGLFVFVAIVAVVIILMLRKRP